MTKVGLYVGLSDGISGISACHLLEFNVITGLCMTISALFRSKYVGNIYEVYHGVSK